jgi:hypothetical protein
LFSSAKTTLGLAAEIPNPEWVVAVCIPRVSAIKQTNRNAVVPLFNSKLIPPHPKNKKRLHPTHPVQRVRLCVKRMGAPATKQAIQTFPWGNPKEAKTSEPILTSLEPQSLPPPKANPPPLVKADTQ